MPENEKTQDELKAELDAAMKAGDWKAIAKAAQAIAAVEKDREKAELEAKKKALEELTLKVKGQFDKYVEKLVADGTLDEADGVWFTYDFGDKSSSLRLMKGAARKAGGGGGGGGGKKFDISTADMLEKHGSEQYKDTDMDFNAAWAAAEGDKNKRFAVREALLKAEGLK